MEVSMVIDEKEKMKLVEELHNKKILFKCFAGWANTIMSLSDEEGNNN